MDIEQWITILFTALLWLPHLISTDAIPNSTFDKYSCDENGTFSWLDSARKEWPSIPFEPYEVSTEGEFIPLVTPTPVQLTPNQSTGNNQQTTTVIPSSPSILRFILPSSLPSPSPSPVSTILSPSPSESEIFNQQSTPIISSVFHTSPLLVPSPSSFSFDAKTIETIETINASSREQTRPTSDLVDNLFTLNASEIIVTLISPTVSQPNQLHSANGEAMVIKSTSSLSSESPLTPLPLPSLSSSYFPALTGTIDIITSELPSEVNLTTNPTLTTSQSDNSNGTVNHHGLPEAAVSNTTKCDPSETRITNPEPDSSFLIRSVLHREESPNDSTNLTVILEDRLEKIFNLAYRKQLDGLGARPDVIKKPTNVKLWNLFWDNSTNELHLVYQIEQDGVKLLGRDLKSILSHVTYQEMSDILGYNVSIKAEPYVNKTDKKSKLASTLKDLDWLPLAMIILSLVVLTFCLALTLVAWQKSRRSRSRLRSNARPINSKINNLNSKLTANTKESLVNWRKVSGPGSKRSFLPNSTSSDRHGNSFHSGGRSSGSGTIDSNHEFEYLSFDSPDSSLKVHPSSENRKRRPTATMTMSSGLSAQGSMSFSGSASRLELCKEKIVPIGELDDIAELSSNSDSYSNSHHHHHDNNHRDPSHRITYVTTKEEMISDYEKSESGLPGNQINCSVPQLIQVHISEQTENIIQAIRSELKKFNPILGSTSATTTAKPNNFKESTSSDA